MIDTGLIGCGKWGKIIAPKLAKVSNLKAIYTSKDKYLAKIHELDWAVIATPDHTHYQIVESCAKAGVNVFCEKPLALTLRAGHALIELCQENNVKLYVSDVENYKRLKVKFSERNKIVRKKSGGGKVSGILRRLAYHDFYLIYRYVAGREITKVEVFEAESILDFAIVFDDLEFRFKYDLNADQRCHWVNETNFLQDQDVLEQMFCTVFEGKPSYEENQKQSLFCLKTIDHLSEYIPS